MAEKVLQTRIISKHITLAQANEGTWKPYEGEIVLARVDTQKPDGHGGLITVPTYLMKVGAKGDDGNLIAIKDLQWAHAPASDVYAWAKQENLGIVDTEVGNVITGIEATDAGITIHRASVATSESYDNVLQDIAALEAGLAQELLDRAAADEGLQDAIDAINKNLDGTTANGIGARLTAVEGVAAGAASDVSTLQNDFNTYKNTTVPELLNTAKSELQGNIDTLSQTVSANETKNSTAHTGFDDRITELEGKVENVANVMDFVGIGTATVTDGVISITVEGVTAFQKGDVVATNDGKEYVYDGREWHEFGYADETEAAVANLKEAFETFRDTTVPTTYATKDELEAETSARTTAIQGIDTAYKKAVADLKTELSEDIGEANTDAYERAIAEATRLDGLQTTAIETAYKKEVADAKTAIETAQSAVDSAQNTKITALETAVGDANSGLVKGLADEIARADAAEKANAAAIKNIQDTYVTKTDKEALEKATQDVADDLSELSEAVTANKSDVDTNFVKVDNGTFTVGGTVIIFDCGGVEEA